MRTNIKILSPVGRAQFLARVSPPLSDSCSFSGFYICNAIILTLFVDRKSISRLDILAGVVGTAGIAFSVVPVIRHSLKVNHISGKIHF